MVFFRSPSSCVPASHLRLMVSICRSILTRLTMAMTETAAKITSSAAMDVVRRSLKERIRNIGLAIVANAAILAKNR